MTVGYSPLVNTPTNGYKTTDTYIKGEIFMLRARAKESIRLLRDLFFWIYDTISFIAYVLLSPILDRMNTTFPKRLEQCMAGLVYGIWGILYPIIFIYTHILAGCIIVVKLWGKWCWSPSVSYLDRKISPTLHRCKPNRWIKRSKAGDSNE